MKYKGLRLRTWLVVKLLKIKIKFDDTMDKKGEWKFGNEIFLKTTAGDMACLHEIGHVLNGYDCCREHDEWRAHGFSVAIAKILRIPKTEINEIEKDMDCYVGLDCVCPRIERRERKI